MFHPHPNPLPSRERELFGVFYLYFPAKFLSFTYQTLFGNIEYMGMVIKKIGRKEYAYLVLREGSRVVHKYLGPADQPEVIKMLSDKEEASSIPENLRSLFWDTNPDRIHIRKNARYIIERILELGDMKAFKWLQRAYTLQIIINILTTSRVITEKSRNFWLTWVQN